jgi:hypothetical protein
LIRQSCQACSSKPLARQYNEMKDSWRASRRFQGLKKSKIDQVEDLKIWDSTQIYNSGRITGATDKGIDDRARQLSTPEAH